MQKSNVISQEVAVKEATDFINKYSDEPLKQDEVQEAYKHLVRAIQFGRFFINENEKPVYKLQDPLTDEKGSIVLEQIEFKTRIKPTALASISAGMDVNKNAFMFALKVMAYVIDQPFGYIDRFSKTDYNTLSSISGLFS
mgnify:CR=1 FL=1